jgi:hypothetical protein
MSSGAAPKAETYFGDDGDLTQVPSIPEPTKKPVTATVEKPAPVTAPPVQHKGKRETKEPPAPPRVQRKVSSASKKLSTF